MACTLSTTLPHICCDRARPSSRRPHETSTSFRARIPRFLRRCPTVHCRFFLSLIWKEELMIALSSLSHWFRSTTPSSRTCNRFRVFIGICGSCLLCVNDFVCFVCCGLVRCSIYVFVGALMPQKILAASHYKEGLVPKLTLILITRVMSTICVCGVVISFIARDHQLPLVPFVPYVLCLCKKND